MTLLSPQGHVLQDQHPSTRRRATFDGRSGNGGGAHTATGTSRIAGCGGETKEAPGGPKAPQPVSAAQLEDLAAAPSPNWHHPHSFSYSRGEPPRAPWSVEALPADLQKPGTRADQHPGQEVQALWESSTRSFQEAELSHQGPDSALQRLWLPCTQTQETGSRSGSQRPPEDRPRYKDPTPDVSTTSTGGEESRKERLSLYLILFDGPFPGAALVHAQRQQTLDLPAGCVVWKRLKRETHRHSVGYAQAEALTRQNLKSGGEPASSIGRDPARAGETHPRIPSQPGTPPSLQIVFVCSPTRCPLIQGLFQGPEVLSLATAELDCGLSFLQKLLWV